VTVLAPAQLLEEAHRMLDESSPGTVSAWSRASALLARQALEEALRQFWRTRAPGVEQTTMRAQLACLPTYISSDRLASDVAYAWHALSRATHHHPYELDPTREELTSLLAMTARLIGAVTPLAGAA
jgi:hypothetical protein